MNQPTREMVEAMVNIATNGALDRIDQRGKRARELYRWGLHPHHAEAGSPLATDNASFEAAYPLALSGGVGVTEESLFPMMSAAENLNAAGLLIEQRSRNRNVHAMPVMQLCRSAMESSARTIWILGDPECEVRRDRALSVLVEQLEQQKRFLIIADASATSGPNQLPSNLVARNRAHQQKQADLVKRLRDNYTVAKPESCSKTESGSLLNGWTNAFPHTTQESWQPTVLGVAQRWRTRGGLASYTATSGQSTTCPVCGYSE